MAEPAAAGAIPAALFAAGSRRDAFAGDGTGLRTLGRADFMYIDGGPGAGGGGGKRGRCGGRASPAGAPGGAAADRRPRTVPTVRGTVRPAVRTRLQRAG